MNKFASVDRKNELQVARHPPEPRPVAGPLHERAGEELNLPRPLQRRLLVRRLTAQPERQVDT